MTILNQKLSDSSRAEILSELLGYHIEDGVIYDEDGDEFFGIDSNCEYSLLTLDSIIRFMVDRAKQRGRVEKSLEIRKALGL